jgi:glycosyltransferase involved in cell wall biosynthesis
MNAEKWDVYLFVDHSLNWCQKVNIPITNDIRERHRIELNDVNPMHAATNVVDSLKLPGTAGVVLSLRNGLPSRRHLAFCRLVLTSNQKLYLYWPQEKAIEYIDREKLRSLGRLNVAARLFTAYRNAKNYRYAIHNPYHPSQHFFKLRAVLFQFRKALNIAGIFTKGLIREPAMDGDGQVSHFSGRNDECLLPAGNQLHNSDIADAIDHALPVPLNPDSLDVSGYGAYLRLDFWAKISSGGSYGHTCYVAKELGGKTKQMRCFMAHRYSLLDEMGIAQSILPEPGPHGNEETISNATAHYYPLLLAEFRKSKPSYIYERICLGNWAGTKLSQELNIPYIVEYNGSEISMKKSFDGGGYEYESFYLDCEMAAFKQATAISVVSKIIRDDLIKRGVDGNKILVNPNGVDLQAYQPDDDLKKTVRQELGWTDAHRVIGFIGTFGGWHGVDILADAMPQIMRQLPEARFLLIGDGNLKHLVDETISKYQLENRVHCAGRVPQKEGARLLAGCDIYVSPHNSHMVDSRFFGSPTKIFEYMAMGGGIVSTKLEQIGEVLSPAIHASQIMEGRELTIMNELSILCEPGNIEEFIHATVYLASHPEIGSVLGRNARTAAAEHFSWEKHVQKLFQFIAAQRENPDPPKAPDSTSRYQEDDFYKTQAHNQWDNDPCGSHYVKHQHRHTMEWFKEAERYRYEVYAPWMFDLMEFDKHRGDRLLEIGGGMGTDLAQYAEYGARIVDFDLAAGHLKHAKENFNLRGLEGHFIQGDAEHISFSDNTFDVVYSNGVLHHIPNMHKVIQEIYRVLKPGGLVIVMVYAENSKHYWENIVYAEGIKKGFFHKYSVGEIMSRVVEISEDDNAARPLVKVYTRDRLKKMFKRFDIVSIDQCQMTASEFVCSGMVPKLIKKMPLDLAGRLMGWNLVVKARKPI